MNPLLKVDFYKPHHQDMYPENMTKLYSNFTPRKSRIPGIDKVVVFGIQHFILEYLIRDFNENFFIFTKEEREISKNGLSESELNGFDSILNTHKKVVIDEYKRHIPINTARIEALWDLGYLPIEIKALDEGTLCPIGVPMLTITNTHPDFGWLVNYLETLISCMLWQPITSATIAYEYRKILNKYALETTGSTEGVQWQGHDFSMRGMSSVESATLSGMGHLLSFTGTDVIPAIYQLENSYTSKGLIGASVPATEHSVMCMGTKESEIDTFKRLLNIYPTGILSVVSDTWDLWKVCTEYLPQLKEEILARDGKLVIRPDSGDPVDITCGTKTRLPDISNYIGDFGNDILRPAYEEGFRFCLEHDKIYRIQHDSIEDIYMVNRTKEFNKPEFKGVIELLWDIFGGTINEQGYKVLDPHIGAIYGDSITMDRAIQICERLKAKGFASTNIVLGIGSYTYQYNTRDIFGFAMKATYGEITHKVPSGSPAFAVEAREIFKDPITDDGTKKSKKGLLNVGIVEATGEIGCCDQRTWEQENQGLLTTILKDSKLTKVTDLDKIRERLNSTL